MAEDIRKAGTAIVKAYGIKDTFFHFEFFRTTDKKTGKTKVMALEVNMRPPGGMITEIYEASHDVNIYKAWADTLIKGRPEGDMTQNVTPPMPAASSGLITCTRTKPFWPNTVRTLWNICP